MSRTWIETAEFGSVIMHCVECPDWLPVVDSGPIQGDTLPPHAGGIPTWKLTHLAASHVQAAHDGKPTP
jgi:hypothetical protein